MKANRRNTTHQTSTLQGELEDPHLRGRKEHFWGRDLGCGTNGSEEEDISGSPLAPFSLQLKLYRCSRYNLAGAVF